VNQPVIRLERRAHAELGDFPIDAAWSPDGRVLLVAGGAGALKWLDTSSTASALQRIGEHAGGALALAWQNGGQQFASSGQDGEVRLWDARARHP
jgi:WD40 repeat protein